MKPGFISEKFPNYVRTLFSLFILSYGAFSFAVGPCEGFKKVASISLPAPTEESFGFRTWLLSKDPKAIVKKFSGKTKVLPVGTLRIKPWPKTKKEKVLYFETPTFQYNAGIVTRGKEKFVFVEKKDGISSFSKKEYFERKIKANDSQAAATQQVVSLLQEVGISDIPSPLEPIEQGSYTKNVFQVELTNPDGTKKNMGTVSVDSFVGKVFTSIQGEFPTENDVPAVSVEWKLKDDSLKPYFQELGNF